MPRKEKDPPPAERKNGGKEKAQSGKAEAADPKEVKTGGWTEERPRIKWAPFPGPPDADEPLRVCMTREAYADLTAHAKESLEVEVCGVLIGEFRQDDDGEYIAIEAIIRGESAKTGGAHVTFTQKTWTHIHETRDRDFSRKHILGWYHTHPGFGVEFSEMDLFIQRNFFSARHQVAYVTDPLGGDEGLCANTADGIRPLSRFWVDGRERKCRVVEEPSTEHANATGGASPALEKTIQSIQERLNQLTHVLDEQREAMNRFLLVCGIAIAVAIVGAFCYSLYNEYTSTREPPKDVKFAELPIPIGNDLYGIGVQFVQWKYPDYVKLKLLSWVQEQLEAEAKKKAAATQPSTAPADKPGPAPSASGGKP